MDIKNSFRNNRGKFYVLFGLLIGLCYLSIILYSVIKPEEKIRETIETNERVHLEQESLTYIESIYNESKKELLIVFGINSVQSLFSDNNLKVEAKMQSERNESHEVKVEKQNPQILTMKIERVDKDYLLARLKMSYKKVGMESISEAITYVSHDKEGDTQLTENDFLNYAIAFKGDFIEQEITLLEERIAAIDQDILEKENSIEELTSDDSLLTDEEKTEINSKIEMFNKQIDAANEEKATVKSEIQQRKEQLKVFNNDN
ncbi:hypothetical protein DD607_05085 [Salmonella sp. 3DZ2-4SM]|nr:hypothetical protein [Mammaliicoccus sciuri]ALI92788.1 Hypothetical protein [Mammaliicoccus sciuri]AQW34634.1 hypothetical protein [Mammaliicoccus sciuri]AQW34687.1 hypothetical protein [Mammaliicoccus sciuri]RXY94810.1 hypothetical protein DD607_05085 [Salmonella sp. 3DZ2-4SM]